MSTASLTEADQYCTFWADGLYFGVPVSGVQEVLRFQPMSAAPRAPKSVYGLINLRGQIVTAVDLRHRLGLSERPADQSPMNVVVRSRGEVVSLLVDDIGDVIDTDGVAIEAVPPTLPASVRAVVTGVVPLPDTILLVLDGDLAADVLAAG
ncbi:MAG TPA: chemotaxis protein CheW [Jatrophihabitans sp.]|jgi:purine-binding chemotaxis protein CheW